MDLLEAESRRVVVPSAVVDEVLAGPTTDRARGAIEAKRFERDDAVPLAEVVEWGLGPGERNGLYLDEALVRNALRAIVGEDIDDV